MSTVATTRHGRTLRLAVDTAPLGTLTAKGAWHLLAAVEAACADADARAVVITGATPGVFVRHYDVASIVRAAEELQASRVAIETFLAAPFARVADAILASDKIFVAAIGGECMGGGFELALACDFRVAGPAVQRIGLPEIRIGLFPGGGGTQVLPRLVGESRALDFILRGRVVDAPSALSMGLVHEVDDDPLAAAHRLAGTFAARSAKAVAAAKRLVRNALDRPLEEGLREERLAFGRLLRDDPDVLGLMRAFLASGVSLGEAP